MFDFHMHSRVSCDSESIPLEMARAALAAGLKEICFTDHIDDDPKGKVLDQRFTPETYSQAYDALEVPGLTIRRGVEFGLLTDNQQSLKTCLGWRDFDFVLGSIHYAGGEDVYFPHYWEGKTLFEGEQIYLEDTYACVLAHDDFDVLGHLTYISKAFSNPAHTPVQLAQHREIVDEILKVLASKGKGMEINTSGVDCCGDFLPAADCFRRFKELGGEIVTMGSDAHTPDRVGQYMDRASAILKEIFGYVCTFQQRRPTFHKL